MKVHNNCIHLLALTFICKHNTTTVNITHSGTKLDESMMIEDIYLEIILNSV